MTRKKKSDTKLSTEEKIAISILATFHLAGAGFLLFAKGGLYQISLDLVPINLIFTSLVVFKYQKEYNFNFFMFLILAFFTGLAFEMVGVNYGWLFGSYSYGPVLGFSLWNTPLLIGLNWVLLCYCSGCLISGLSIPTFFKWFISVVLLVGFDYFMEPVAMKNDFWSWEGGRIPFQNYLGWALVSSVIMFYFHFFSFQKRNMVAISVWFIQIGFFVLQNLF